MVGAGGVGEKNLFSRVRWSEGISLRTTALLSSRTTNHYTSKIRRLPPFWRTFCIADDEVASSSMSMRFSPIYGALVMVIEGH